MKEILCCVSACAQIIVMTERDKKDGKCISQCITPSTFWETISLVEGEVIVGFLRAPLTEPGGTPGWHMVLNFQINQPTTEFTDKTTSHLKYCGLDLIEMHRKKI